MTKKETHSSIKPIAEQFLQELMKNYWDPLYDYVEETPDLIKTVPGFLLGRKKIILYIGRTHIAVEYIGSEFLKELNRGSGIEVNCYDYSKRDCNFLEKIVGFEYDSTLGISIPLAPFSEDLLLPTNRGWDKLTELRWNFAAQNSIMCFNAPCPTPTGGQFTRIVNGIFFDADESGLKTRRIKWIDFFPIFFDGSDKEVDKFGFDLAFLKEFVVPDAHYIYPIPKDFKFLQLPKINKFIEIWGDWASSETDLTSFLSSPENSFILTMKFGAISIHSEIICKWQSEDRRDIRPDFFVVQPNGYADIVEFKLPDISKNAIVGSDNRETFGAWLHSYIAQTRVYASYFDDPNNRKWFEEMYGFKVYKPKRWLVIGRRHNFESEVWREILHDFRDLEILTFDDLVDGVVAQFYK